MSAKAANTDTTNTDTVNTNVSCLSTASTATTKGANISTTIAGTASAASTEGAAGTAAPSESAAPSLTAASAAPGASAEEASGTASLVAAQRAYFESGATRSLAFRLAQLGTLKRAIKAQEERILAALKTDLNKSAFEAYATEIGVVLHEISYAERRLAQWMKPKRVASPLISLPAHSRIYPEPHGVTLIMSPWNYPFQLALVPLVGAIAAGNCALVKPGSYAPATSQLLEELLASCFEPHYVAVVQGGRAVNASLLQQRFDFIFFTGGSKVGTVVMTAAAQHLTPVCLELGGKSPCVVDKTANLDLAAKRIAWGKGINAGQTCIAPDYLLVERSVKEELIQRLAYWFTAFWGESPLDNPELPRIINRTHFNRLCALAQSGGHVVYGGQANSDTLAVAPTIIDEVGWDMPLMGEELFGPLLPVLTFDSLDEAAALINARPTPLALYLFTGLRQHERYLLEAVPFGGGCVNDTLMHAVSTALPFGGKGASGMGGYHGKLSFDTFSHYKSVLKKSRWEPSVRYAPYGERPLWLIKRVLR